METAVHTPRRSEASQQKARSWASSGARPSGGWAGRRTQGSICALLAVFVRCCCLRPLRLQVFQLFIMLILILPRRLVFVVFRLRLSSFVCLLSSFVFCFSSSFFLLTHPFPSSFRRFWCCCFRCLAFPYDAAAWACCDSGR